MKICQYLTPDLIVPDLKALNKEGVLKELADWIADHIPESEYRRGLAGIDGPGTSG